MIFLSHLLSDKLISLLGQYDFCKNIFCPYRLAVCVKTNASFKNCQKQVAGLLEKEQRHGVKLNIG